MGISIAEAEKECAGVDTGAPRFLQTRHQYIRGSREEGSGM